MTSQPEYTWDLFISYPEANRAWVEGYLMDVLRASGIRVSSQSEFEPGQPFLSELEKAVTKSARTLLVLSSAYQVDSLAQFTTWLVESYGLDFQTWPLIPLILDNVQLPQILKMLQPLDARERANWPRVVEQLCKTLQRPPPQFEPTPPCPYRGMKPFGEKDSDHFFGREGEVGEMVTDLHLYPFLAIIGRSGSGKSSLVFAGLIPALRASQLFGPGEWLVLSLHPGESPLASLEGVLGSDGATPSQLVARLTRSEAHARNLLLVVDQFEELFAATPSDAKAFQDKLRQFICLPNCYVILTVRADFYPDLMLSPLWGEIQSHRLELGPLQAAGLRQAIVRPAESAKVYIDPILVERLIAEAGGEPGILPFVQETLLLLWEKLDRRYLGLYAYEHLLPPSRPGEDADLARAGLRAAIEFHADNALKGLKPDQIEIARRIFLDLVQLGDGRADTRRQRSVGQLRSSSDDTGNFQTTLRHLTENRLLTFSGDEASAESRVDIAHEVLITAWHTLRDWISDARPWLLIHRRLSDAAVEWEEHARDAGYLYSESRLNEVARFSRELENDSSTLEQEFLRASRASLDVANRARRQQRAWRILTIILSTVVVGAILILALMFASETGPFLNPGEWKPGEGLEVGITDLAVDPRQPQVLYASTSKQGIFKSVNGGRNWKLAFPFDQEAQAVVVARDEPDTVYVGVNGGRFFRVDNTGPHDLGLVAGLTGFDDLILDPVQPGTLYASQALHSTISKSTNLGKDWVTLPLPLTRPSLGTIAVAADGATETALYAGTGDGQVLLSRDRGQQWQTIARLGSTLFISEISPGPEHSGPVYVGTTNGLYRLVTRDGQIESERMADGWQTLSIAADKITPQIVSASLINGNVMLARVQSGVLVTDTIGSGKNFPGVMFVNLKPGDRAPFYLYAKTDRGFYGWLPSRRQAGWFAGP